MMKTKIMYVLFNFIFFINQAAPLEMSTTSKCNLTLLEEEDDHQLTDTSSEFHAYILDISNSSEQKNRTENSNLFLPQRWYSVQKTDSIQLQLQYGAYTSIFKKVYRSKYRKLSVNATPIGCFYNLNDDELENVARTFFWNELRDENKYICSAHVSQKGGYGNLIFRCCHQTVSQNYDCVDIEQEIYLRLMYITSWIIAVLTFIYFAYKLFQKKLKYPILSSKRYCEWINKCCSKCISDRFLPTTFEFYPNNLMLKRTGDNVIEPNKDYKWVIGNATKQEWDSFINIKNGESVTVKAIKLRVKKNKTIEKGRKLMDMFEYINFWVKSNCCELGCECCICSCCKSCKCGVLCHIVLYLIWILFSIVSLAPLCLTILNNKNEIPCEVYKQKNLTCSDYIYKEYRVSIFLKVYTAFFILFFIITCGLKCFGNPKKMKVIIGSYIVTLLSTIPCCILVHFIVYFMIRFVFTCIFSGDTISNVTLFSLPFVWFITAMFRKTKTDIIVEDIVKLHKKVMFIYSRKCKNANEAVTFTLDQNKSFEGQLYFRSSKLIFNVNQPLIFLGKDEEFYISKKFACAPFPDIEKKSAWEYNKFLAYVILLLASLTALVCCYIEFNSEYSASSAFVSLIGYAVTATKMLSSWISTINNEYERDYNYQLLEEYKNIYATHSETWTVTEIVTESDSSATNSSFHKTPSNQLKSDGSDTELKNNSSSKSIPVASTSSEENDIAPITSDQNNSINYGIDSRKKTEQFEMDSINKEILTNNEKPKENIPSSDIKARTAKHEHKNNDSVEKEPGTEKKTSDIKRDQTLDEEKKCLLEKKEMSVDV